jgi:guanylate kinase
MSGSARQETDGVPLLVVLSGPSGVGKDAVLQQMRSSNAPYHFTVTATTRTQRDNETEGVDYIFVSRDDFRDMIADDELLEWAEVYGNLYGVPKTQVTEALQRGQDVFLKIDVQGADNIRRQVPGAVYVFLAPPSMDELESRLNRRMTESADALKLRLETASNEMQEAAKFDHVVVNHQGKLDETAEQIESVMERERSRTGRKKIVI